MLDNAPYFETEKIGGLEFAKAREVKEAKNSSVSGFRILIGTGIAVVVLSLWSRMVLYISLHPNPEINKFTGVAGFSIKAVLIFAPLLAIVFLPKHKLTSLDFGVAESKVNAMAYPCVFLSSSGGTRGYLYVDRDTLRIDGVTFSVRFKCSDFQSRNMFCRAFQDRTWFLVNGKTSPITFIIYPFTKPAKGMSKFAAVRLAKELWAQMQAAVPTQTSSVYPPLPKEPKKPDFWLTIRQTMIGYFSLSSLALLLLISLPPVVRENMARSPIELSLVAGGISTLWLLLPYGLYLETKDSRKKLLKILDVN